MAKKVFHFSNGYKVLADQDVNIKELTKSVNKVHKALKITDEMENQDDKSEERVAFEKGNPMYMFFTDDGKQSAELAKLVDVGDWDNLKLFVYENLLKYRNQLLEADYKNSAKIVEDFLDDIVAMNNKEKAAFKYYLDNGVPVRVSSAEQYEKESNIKEAKKKVPAYKTISKEKVPYEWHKQSPINEEHEWTVHRREYIQNPDPDAKEKWIETGKIINSTEKFPQKFRTSNTASKKGEYTEYKKEPLLKKNGEQRMVSRPLRVGEKENQLMKLQKKLDPEFYTSDWYNTSVSHEYFYQLKGPKHSLEKIYCLQLGNRLWNTWLKLTGNKAIYQKKDPVLYQAVGEEYPTDEVPVVAEINKKGKKDSVSPNYIGVMTRYVNQYVDDLKNRMVDLANMCLDTNATAETQLKEKTETTSSNPNENALRYVCTITLKFDPPIKKKELYSIASEYGDYDDDDDIGLDGSKPKGQTVIGALRSLVGTNISSAQMLRSNIITYNGNSYRLSIERTKYGILTGDENDDEKTFLVSQSKYIDHIDGQFIIIIEMVSGQDKLYKEDGEDNYIGDSVDNSFSGNVLEIIDFLNNDTEKSENDIHPNAEAILAKLDYFIENGDDIYIKADWTKDDAKEAIAEDVNPLIDALEKKCNTAYLKLLLKNVKEKKDALIKAWKLDEDDNASKEEVEEVEQDTEEAEE